jgi:hypothetical protein
VKEATVLTATVSLAIGEPPASDTIDVADKALPFTPATKVDIVGDGCPGAAAVRVIPRLVTTDGLVALGGARYLVAQPQGALTIDPSGAVRGTGTLLGNYGGVALSVPVTSGAPCAH